MRKIAIVTSTRAEYGMLTPLIRKVYLDSDLELNLLVTGMHLSDKYGYTVNEIINDGFPITRQIPILGEGNTPYDISLAMARAQICFAEYFRDERPDMLVILGDRTEMLGIAAAAVNERIPIAHISGGEVTAGAVDEAIRHSLTKMAYLHFPGTEIARRRVIQLGENPDRVFDVGLLTIENIRRTDLYQENEIRKILGVADSDYVMVTFHPVTQENTAKEQIQELCNAMDENSNYFYFITMANSDTGSDVINKYFSMYASQRKNVKLTPSLGMKKYLSALKYSEFILGNSSSGVGEAPILGIPSVNIGDRQRGRLIPETVVNCEPTSHAISLAMKAASKIPHVPTKLFGDIGAADKIINVIKDNLFNKTIDFKKKQFYDVDWKTPSPEQEMRIDALKPV